MAYGRQRHPAGRLTPFVWTDIRPDHDTYVKIILNSICERQRWRSQYEHAKTAAATTADAPLRVSTVAQPP